MAEKTVVAVYKCTNDECEIGQWEVAVSAKDGPHKDSNVCGQCGKRGKKLPASSYITGGVTDAG